MRSPRCQRSRWSARKTAASWPAVNGRARANRSRTSGRCPCSQRLTTCSVRSSAASARRPRTSLDESFMFVLIQPQFGGDALDGPAELDAAGLGITAQPAGDFAPTQPVAAQIGEFALLSGEALAKTLQEL